MAYIPEHIKRWTSADPATGQKGNYGGGDWSEYYVVLIQNRDSDTIERSNFTSAKKQLEELSGDPEAKQVEETLNLDTPLVTTMSTNHWAVGWVEWLLIHEKAPDSILQEADSIAEHISEHSILDENHQSELEHKEASEYFDSWVWRHEITRNFEDYIDWLEGNAPTTLEQLQSKYFSEYLDHNQQVSNITFKPDFTSFVDFTSAELKKSLSTGDTPDWFEGSIGAWKDIMALAYKDKLAYDAVTLEDLAISEETTLGERTATSDAWLAVKRFRDDAWEYIHTKTS